MSSTVQCVTCTHFNLREAPQWAELGFGTCVTKAKPSGTYMSPFFPRICKDHLAIAPEKAMARIEWLRPARSGGA
ncbi:hypothetical protein ACLQ8Z_06120 [Bordetella hinzii]|uniref:N-acetyltransferase YedL n=1 Tax=Bordetella hinzii OH87 BAL007II TaxID=1331262 RepID=A0ABR4R3Q1_9BORD|nr:hypothetical protein [Bordetella hinzii]KCB25025.1 hypothetical protein L544_1076 [Bordetella hinzii OH87 BAL007II]QDJ43816.1 hypothetical protein CBR70_22310 [Bordetella hinzii]